MWVSILVEIDGPDKNSSHVWEFQDDLDIPPSSILSMWPNHPNPSDFTRSLNSIFDWFQNLFRFSTISFSSFKMSLCATCLSHEAHFTCRDSTFISPHYTLDRSCKLARWLSIKYNSLQKFESASIKNLIDKIKNVDLNSEDRLVSFDVEALFPSIPVEKLMKYLEK